MGNRASRARPGKINWCHCSNDTAGRKPNFSDDRAIHFSSCVMWDRFPSLAGWMCSPLGMLYRIERKWIYTNWNIRVFGYFIVLFESTRAACNYSECALIESLRKYNNCECTCEVSDGEQIEFGSSQSKKLPNRTWNSNDNFFFRLQTLVCINRT